MYAKSIGGQGKVLASGATGQSVGLLALDAERQAGFGTAAETAKLESKAAQAGTQMDIVQDQAQSSINNAYSRLIPPTAAAQLEAMPVGMGKDLNLGIPEYNWADKWQESTNLISQRVISSKAHNNLVDLIKSRRLIVVLKRKRKPVSRSQISRP